MGGESYDGVVDESGSIEADSSGLPEVGFYVTLPDDLNRELKEALHADPDKALDLSPYLTFHSGSKIWTLALYDGADTSAVNIDGTEKYIYRLISADDQDPVRMQFTDEDGNVQVSDEFDLNNALYSQYTMSIYPGAVDQSTVYAELDLSKIGENGGNPADISYTTYAAGSEDGVLTIRGVTAEGGSVPVTENVTQPVEQITATVPADAEYYVNDSQVKVVNGTPSLLVDNIISNEESDRLLTEKAIETLDITASDKLQYDFRYLDLVDSSNGNTWITSSKPVTVYWPYPEGTDQNTRFYLVHYDGLDREMSIEGVEQAIADCNAASIIPQNTEHGISFETSGFSPFVLIWEASGGGSDNNPDGGGGSSNNKPDKPDDLNTEDHFAYIIGYPKDYRTGEPTDDESLWPVEPEGNITRAEVATIFFRMLTDDARNENWSQTNSFTDVASTEWYNNAISTLANMGIVSGDPDGSFRPDDSITRAEFTKIAVGFFDKTGDYVEGTYEDVSASDWYADFIDAAVDLGLIEGYPDGTIRPNASITRAEACTIVNRTLGRVPDKDHLLAEDEMRVWPDSSNTNAWYYAQIQEATNSHDYNWITEDGEEIEEWTDKLADRDWAQLEREWSDANSAPGGEVVD